MLRFKAGQIRVYEGNKRKELGGGNLIRTKEEERRKRRIRELVSGGRKIVARIIRAFFRQMCKPLFCSVQRCRIVT